MNTHPIPTLRRRICGSGRRFLALTVATALLSSGCTSLRTTPVPHLPGQSAHVYPGQTVRVTTRTGEHATVKIATIAPDGFAGRNRAFLYEDLTKLEVRKYDSRKTTILVTTVFAGAVGLALAGAPALAHNLATGYIAAAP